MTKNRYVAAVVLVVGAGVVACLLRFNQAADSYNHYIVGNMIGLLFIPGLTILFLFREGADKFGFDACTSWRVWGVTAFLFACMLPVLYIVSRWQGYQDYYPLFKHYPEFKAVFAGYPRANPFASQPMLLLYAEASYGLYLFCWEFFFRGYLLFGLMRSIGWSAVIVQALAFGLLHYGKPTSELVASFGAGVVLGILALNARSFAPCFLLHWACSVSFDLLVVAGRH